MVQFIPAHNPLEGLKQGLGDIAQSLGPFFQRRQAGKQRKTESEALSKAGYKVPENVIDPRLRERLLEGQIKNKASAADIAKDAQTADVFGKYFGKEAKEVYPHLTEGGKTKFFEQLLTDRIRGINTGETLRKFIAENPQDIKQDTPQIEENEQDIENPLPTPKVNPKTEKVKYPKINPPQDLTAPELVKYRQALRKENDPKFTKVKDKVNGLNTQSDHLTVLENLSDKIPNISRFMINSNGQLRPLAQMLGLVPKEAQRFVKTVKDFITGAKDIFGSRVTNFDIQAFEARLPSLLNTKEGRNEIIDQMKIFTELEKNYNQALKDIYKHYKLEGITQEEAEELAEKQVAPRETELRSQLTKIGVLSIPEGRVAVEINGKRGHVPQNQVETILKRGGKVI